MNRNLVVDGYYVGKIDELTFNRTTFEEDVSFIKSLYENKNVYYNYRHSCENIHNIDFSDLTDIVGPIFNRHQIPMIEKEERTNLIKKYNIGVWQQWGELRQDYNIDSTTPPEGSQLWEQIKTDKIHHAMYNFRKIWLDNFSKLYPEVDINNLRFQDSITLYEDGDFINWHKDGEDDHNIDTRRICAILMYLSDESEYNDGGGKFLVEIKPKKIPTTTDIPTLPENYEAVLPLKGNFVVLDFKTNNLRHAVEEVKNNFKRYCYLTFVHEKRQ